MAARPLRVLVVDDSAFARKVLREILQAAGMEVVGIARDGLDALEQINTLQPDVITLDLVMPHLDGVGVLRALAPVHAARVVVVSSAGDRSALAIEALSAGASSIVRKPTSLATDQLYELRGELLLAVRAASLARGPQQRHVSPALPDLRASTTKLVVIGTSTGGPQALAQLLAALPASFPVPLAIALHIPAGYTEELSKRLDRSSAIEVREAEDGLLLQPGRAVLARGGLHMTLAGAGSELRIQLTSQSFDELHKPSVDILFESAAERVGGATLGVVLTGMGSDGLRGARAIRAAGGRVLTESASSCVVYGMPSAVKEAGLSSAESPLEGMALEIARHL